MSKKTKAKALPPIDECAVLRSELSLLSLRELEVSRILKQPPDQTMKDLPKHARLVMKQLKRCLGR